MCEDLKIPAPGVLIHVGTSNVDRVYVDIDDEPYWIVVETSGRTKSIRRVSAAEMERHEVAQDEINDLIRAAEEAGMTPGCSIRQIKETLTVGYPKARAIYEVWRNREVA